MGWKGSHAIIRQRHDSHKMVKHSNVYCIIYTESILRRRAGQGSAGQGRAGQRGTGQTQGPDKTGSRAGQGRHSVDRVGQSKHRAG